MQVYILSYGVGNLYSLETALKRENADTRLITDVRKTRSADALLLPGVGNFTEVARKIQRQEILDLAKNGKPLIGICLGLQLFLEGSEEGPGRGLGLFPGKAKRLPRTVKVPQIGWNTLTVSNENEVLDRIENNSWVYYLHSYYPETDGDWVVATTKYGVEYPALITRKNLFGAQFHPEKSGRTGRRILRNILRLIKR
jgi:glutamine amidotransferase